MPTIRKKPPAAAASGDGGEAQRIIRKKYEFTGATGNQIIVPAAAGTLPSDPDYVDVNIEANTYTRSPADFTLAGNNVNLSFTLPQPVNGAIIWWESA